MNADKEENLRAALKWTSKIDLFKKKYVIIPINEMYAIIHSYIISGALLTISGTIGIWQ
jgi:Ulp1 family protease